MIEGYVDGVFDGHLCGWSIIKENLELESTVVVLEGNKEVGRFTASDFRKDLFDLGVGKGFYGFKWKLPIKFYDGNEHVFNVMCLQTRRELPNSPIRFESAIGVSVFDTSGLSKEDWYECFVELNLEERLSKMQLEHAISYTYQIVLGREADHAGLVSYSKQLANGDIRFGQMVIDLISSEERTNNKFWLLPSPNHFVEILDSYKSIYVSYFLTGENEDGRRRKTAS